MPDIDNDEDGLQCGVCGASIKLGKSKHRHQALLEHYADKHDGEWPPEEAGAA